MRAAILQATGDDRLEVVDDVEVAAPGPGEVTIDIEATGVCHSDVSAMSGTIPQPAPAVLGHEGAGIVSAIGEGVSDLAVGDHVVVAWSPPCGQCVNCVARRSPHLCTEIQFTSMMTPRFSRGGEELSGMAGTGTFAESLTVPQQAAIKIDDDVPFDIASLIGCGVTTGVGAVLNTAEVTPGSSVVVFGCGGVGISAIQGARIAGAGTIVAVDLVADKLERAKGFGATHAVHPDELEALSTELTGDGFDFAFEAIGLPATIRAAYDAVRRGGTACIVGVGRSEDEVTFNAFEIFFSEKRFIGSYYGSADVRTEFHRLLQLWRDGELDLDGMVSRRIGLDDVNEAIEAMRRGEGIRHVITF